MRIPFSVMSQNETLLGLLHVANTQKDIPVVIITCFGRNGSRSDVHRMNVKLGEYCEKNCVNLCTFDYSGTGVSEGNFFYSTIKKRVENLHDIINFIKGCFNGNLKIYLLGFCEGAKVVLNYVGTYNDVLLKGAIFWNPLLNTEENINTTSGTQARLFGVHPQFGKVYSRFSGLFMNMEMLKEMLYDNSIIYLKRIKPVLFIFGENDNVSKNVYKYVLKNMNNNWTLEVINSSNHLFEKIEYEHNTIKLSIDWVNSNA